MTATTPRVADGLRLRAESPGTGQGSRFTVELLDVRQSDIETPGADGYPPIRELRRRPSRQGESGPPAELIAVAACPTIRRR